MKRIISLLLSVCLMLGLFPVTVRADEIQTKYLKVSVKDEVKTYECLWNDEEIYCSVEDLAEITNYDWVKMEDSIEYQFFREYDELDDYAIELQTSVTISIDNDKAEIEAMQESYTTNCYFMDDELFLPLEKLLYLLHAEWTVNEDTVYVTPMPLTILDFLAIHQMDLVKIASQSEDVLINTGWLLSDTKIGQAVYSTIAEVFSDFDGKIFMLWWPGEGHVETAECYENAILQLAKEDKEFVGEEVQQDALELAADSVFYLGNEYMNKVQNIMAIPENIDDIVQSVPDAIELLEDMGKEVPKFKNIAENIEEGKIDTLFLSIPEIKSKTKQLEAAGDGLAILQCLWNTYDTATRVKNWNDEYLAQLQILANYQEFESINDSVANYVRSSAQRLIDSYQNPSEAAANEAVQSTMGLLLSKTFDASPFGKAFSIMNAVGSCYGVFDVDTADRYDMYAELSVVTYSVKIEQMVKYLLDYNNPLYTTDKLTNEKIEEYRNQLMLYLRMNLRNKSQLYNLNLKGNEDKNWVQSKEAKELYDEIVLVYTMLVELIETKNYDAFVILECDLDNMYSEELLNDIYLMDVGRVPINGNVILKDNIEEYLSRINYYDLEGKLIYYENYAYYDNKRLCSKTLHSVNYMSDGTSYIGDIYTFLYLYDEHGNLKEEVLDTLGISEWYDSNTGEIILDYEYDTNGNSKKIVIYPKSESIEQEKFGVDLSKTEKIYSDILLIPINLDNGWERLYLNEVFSEEEPTDMTTGRFIYIDDNSEPELWLDYGYGYAGAEIFTTRRDSINKISMNHGVANWIERGNLLLVSEGHMGLYYDTLYRIENGEFIMQAQGRCEDIDVYEDLGLDYYWNNVKVTEHEYGEKLNEFFEPNNAVDIYQNIYTYKQCKLLLQSIAAKNNYNELENSNVNLEQKYDSKEVCTIVVDYYNKKNSTDAYIIFEHEIEETDKGYFLILRNQEGNEANVLVTGLSVNIDTGQVIDDWGNEWNLYDY